jgi:hypothetical protein
MTRKLFPVFVLILSALTLAGCPNMGDENPITPEQMDANRKADGEARGNFNPSNTPPKPGN